MKSVRYVRKNSGKNEPKITPIERRESLNIPICHHLYVYDLNNFIVIYENKY